MKERNLDQSPMFFKPATHRSQDGRPGGLARTLRRGVTWCVGWLVVWTSLEGASRESAAWESPSELRAATRSESGEPVCGLGKEFHAGRRAALRETMGEGVFIMRGLAQPRDYQRFYQDKNFWYLTGVASPNAALVIDGRSGNETLYLPRHNGFQEQWDGEVWDVDDAWVPELTGFEQVRPIDELDADLQELLVDKPKVLIVKTPWIGLAGGNDMAWPHVRARAE
ncbi:MAG: aminopeptidase P N-terminal domain-containing protein, partial [Planctomycetales bacterium]|nr:aminopeptidase P N-terminal domain-containing protein [Planctomycetales bacterium]